MTGKTTKTFSSTIQGRLAQFGWIANTCRIGD
jgi:hypothetical protein